MSFLRMFRMISTAAQLLRRGAGSIIKGPDWWLSRRRDGDVVETTVSRRWDPVPAQLADDFDPSAIALRLRRAAKLNHQRGPMEG